jgi:hypothetical protein
VHKLVVGWAEILLLDVELRLDLPELRQEVGDDDAVYVKGNGVGRVERSRLGKLRVGREDVEVVVYSGTSACTGVG